MSACGGEGVGGAGNNPPSQGPVETPAAPVDVVAVAGDGRVTLTWDASAGATSCTVYMATQSTVTKTNYAMLSGGMRHDDVTSAYTHTGLANGATYYFVLTAGNSAGESAELELSNFDVTLYDIQYDTVGAVATLVANHSNAFAPITLNADGTNLSILR
ncbi:MAG: hypothetical protein L0Z73_11645 [Gammaproteobacteria bacterium]|nr:hypothetical protein [Gammaproteobacteria bacterium]